mmetsp:Transcript_46079/g.128205  ORF Transcript_46079/g.128205 Transcript_46079/m.128205 type:complete len:222 (-) Transcript_46079:289-954(-)
MEDLKAKQEKAKAERVAQQNRQMEAQAASSNIRSNVMKSRPTKPKKEVVAVAPKSKALAALLARESPNGSIGMDGGGGGGSGRSSHGGFHSSLSSSGSMLRSSGSMGSPSRQSKFETFGDSPKAFSTMNPTISKRLLANVSSFRGSAAGSDGSGLSQHTLEKARASSSRRALASAAARGGGSGLSQHALQKARGASSRRAVAEVDAGVVPARQTGRQFLSV